LSFELVRSREASLKRTCDIPRIVIAGASSNVGKTTVTAGLIAALRQEGLVVQPFKCGPDYVDPSYHERAAGRPCRNLDTWMLSDTQLLESFARACQDVDIAVVEGVMGLYDGSDWHDERGSTAQISKLLNAPVLLVLDISGSARSAAAAVLGYNNFDPAVAIRGVVLNFAGSQRHAQGCAEAIAHATALPMMGWLPRELQLRIPERHLGLVPGGEQVDSDALISQMGAAVSERFDVASIVDVARQAARADTASPARNVGATGDTASSAASGADTNGRAKPGTAAAPRGAARLTIGGSARHTVSSSVLHGGATGDPPSLAAGGDASNTASFATGHSASDAANPDGGATGRAQRRTPRPIIAVARDEAFCFYYPENLELLIEEGAAIEFFSPLHGERPGANAVGVYLGGGYPELHGPALASNMGLWTALRDLHATDAPIYAECGGFMVLTEELSESAGHTWPMAGLLPGFARMSSKLAALGYRHATALRANLLAEPGDSLRGHEFRYSSWVCETNAANRAAAWQVRGTRSDTPVEVIGYAEGNLLASYLHVHFGQRRELAKRFVQRLQRTV
jgi:cobyrinic acid a,c-diamide synthase